MKFLFEDKVKKMKCRFCNKKTLKYKDDSTYSLILNQPGSNKAIKDKMGEFSMTTLPVYLIFCTNCGYTDLFLKEDGNSKEEEK